MMDSVDSNAEGAFAGLEPVGVVPVPGLHNLRDLGGLPAAGGRTTVRGVLYRGDAPDPARPDGVRRLRELDVRTVVDLREPDERRDRPNPMEGEGGVAYHPVDLIAGIRDGWSELAYDRPLGAFYVRSLEVAGPAFARAVEALASAGAGARMVHCSVGKDRTGMVAALVLDAVGVPHPWIVRDYVATARFAAPVYERMRIRARARGDLDALERLLTSDAVDMEAFLAALRDEHGGATAYLVRHGLAEARLAWLREAFTEADTDA